MVQKAGGIGTGRSRKASALEPRHFPSHLITIAAIRQFLPSAGLILSSLAKPQLVVASAFRADFEPEAQHYKSGRSHPSHPVAPSQTQSHHLSLWPSGFSLYPLAFSLSSNPVKPTQTNPQSAIRNPQLEALHYPLWSRPPTPQISA